MIARTSTCYAAALLIGSEPVCGQYTADVRSPATGDVVGTYQLASAAQVETAIAATQAAQRRWADLTGAERESRMRAASANARSQADGIGRLMACEQGKPFAQSRSEVIAACDLIDYYASEAVRIEGQILPTEKGDLRSLVIRQPLGVVAAITPWNYPIALLSWKIGPALASGCGVVVKPTPVTPLSPYAFCLALCQGGLPAGLITFLTGDDVTVGQALVTHPKVAKIAFTGSTTTGRTLMALAGPLFKKMTLELGGQCPAIVCPDADLALTAKAIAYKAFRNMGQSCSSINRIYAHASIHDRLVELVCAEASKLSIGDGLEPPDVDLGPMTTAAALAKVKEHVADALSHGARLVCGGRAPDGRAGQGYFYLPTVLTGMTSTMAMMRSETFGPVAPFMAFNDVEQAVTEANSGEFGLCAFLFTRDLGRTLRIAERLESGTVCVNHVAVNSSYGPYEGWKTSGVGVELGRGAMDEYLHSKHIKIAVPPCS